LANDHLKGTAEKKGGGPERLEKGWKAERQVEETIHESNVKGGLSASSSRVRNSLRISRRLGKGRIESGGGDLKLKEGSWSYVKVE